MRHPIGLFAALVALVGAAGCDDPKPGHINWSVIHDPALLATTATDRDVRGTLLACLFAKNPFTNPGQKTLGEQSSPFADLHLPGARIDGRPAGEVAAFPDLPAGGVYTLVLMLDDDQNNPIGKCVNQKGEVQVSARDPLSVTDKVMVMSMVTTQVDATFDHRYEERI